MYVTIDMINNSNWLPSESVELLQPFSIAQIHYTTAHSHYLLSVHVATKIPRLEQEPDKILPARELVG